MAFNATLTGEKNNPTDITYNWRYQIDGPDSDGQDIEPPNNRQQGIVINFPKNGNFVVYCDITYKNGDSICLPNPPFGTLYLSVEGSTVIDDVSIAPSRADALSKYRAEKAQKEAADKVAREAAAKRAKSVKEKANMNRRGRIADALAAKRAKEDAMTLVKPSPVPSRSPSPIPKEIKELKPLDTTGKTLDAIFEQLKRGSGAKQLDTIAKDVEQYGSGIQNTPISKFIDKYKMVSTIFAFGGTTSNYIDEAEGGTLVENQAHYKEIIDRIWVRGKKFAWQGNPHSKDGSGDIYNYLRQFFFDFIKTYVLQYSYSGRTIAEKADFLFDEFKQFIGDIYLKKFDGDGDCKITLFDTLGITKQQVTEYIMAWSPGKEFFAGKGNPNGMPTTLATKPATQIKRERCR